MPLMSLSDVPRLVLGLATADLHPASTVAAVTHRAPVLNVPRLLRARLDGPIS